MTKSEKQTIEEVLEAMRVHHGIVQSSLDVGVKIPIDQVDDMEEGMRISMTKLEFLLKIS